jgi:hypothetical protein
MSLKNGLVILCLCNTLQPKREEGHCGRKTDIEPLKLSQLPCRKDTPGMELGHVVLAFSTPKAVRQTCSHLQVVKLVIILVVVFKEPERSIKTRVVHTCTLAGGGCETLLLCRQKGTPRPLFYPLCLTC